MISSKGNDSKKQTERFRDHIKRTLPNFDRLIGRELHDASSEELLFLLMYFTVEFKESLFGSAFVGAIAGRDCGGPA